MTKFLILHGKGASPKANWFMWLKGKLIGEGHTAWLPQLPDAKKPNAKTYTDFLLSNKDFTFDSDTIIIGHSSGAVEILNLLQHLPQGVEIKAAILVSAFKDNLGSESLSGLFTEPFDFAAIKQHCDKFTLVHSDNDPYVPFDQAEYLADMLDAELVQFEGQGHFDTELSPDYKQFPELLDIIQSVE